MNHLFTYVSATKQRTESAFLVAQTCEDSSYDDDGVTVACSESLFTFANGVIIKKSTEVTHDDLPEEGVCKEHWVRYEVVSAPSHLAIWPTVKSFTNLCQEAFWLKMNACHCNVAPAT